MSLAQTANKKSKKRSHKKRHLHSLLQLSDDEESDVQIGEETTEEKPDKNAAMKVVEVVQPKATAASAPSTPEFTVHAASGNQAVLITGATHARELLSM